MVSGPTSESGSVSITPVPLYATHRMAIRAVCTAGGDTPAHRRSMPLRLPSAATPPRSPDVRRVLARLGAWPPDDLRHPGRDPDAGGALLGGLRAAPHERARGCAGAHRDAHTNYRHGELARRGLAARAGAVAGGAAAGGVSARTLSVRLSLLRRPSMVLSFASIEPASAAFRTQRILALLTSDVLSRVKCAVCAIGYLNVSADDFRAVPSLPI